MFFKTAHARATRRGALSAAALLCTIGGVIAPAGAWAADTASPGTSGAALEDIAAEDDSLLLSPATGSSTGITQVGVGTAAVPATADDVPTHYEVHGSTLTQIVDHTGGRFAYPVVADPVWLAPSVVRCLIGIGINGATITRIASSGSPGAVLAAFGYGAFRCVLGR